MTIHIVSWSEISTARQCFHKHDLAYKQRWKSPREGAALTIGKAWHRVLEAHYRRDSGETVEDIFFELKRDEVVVSRGREDIYLVDLLTWMYSGYVERWGMDPEWEVLEVERAYEVPIARGWRLKLRLDLLVRAHGGLWIVDNKSGFDLPTEKELELDDQFGLYTWALRRMGLPIMGSIYNSAITRQNKVKPQTLTSRFERYLLSRNDRELETIAAEALEDIKAAYRDRTSRRQPDTERCRFRCSFTDACLTARKGAPNETGMLEALGFVQDFTRH